MPRTIPFMASRRAATFNAFYDCYCYLPLYIFAGRHLLATTLRTAEKDAAHGARDGIEGAALCRRSISAGAPASV